MCMGVMTQVKGKAESTWEWGSGIVPSEAGTVPAGNAAQYTSPDASFDSGGIPILNQIVTLCARAVVVILTTNGMPGRMSRVGAAVGCVLGWREGCPVGLVGCSDHRVAITGID